MRRFRLLYDVSKALETVLERSLDGDKIRIGKVGMILQNVVKTMVFQLRNAGGDITKT
jgi:hypothetical protein